MTRDANVLRSSPEMPFNYHKGTFCLIYVSSEDDMFTLTRKHSATPTRHEGTVLSGYLSESVRDPGIERVPGPSAEANNE